MLINERLYQNIRTVRLSIPSGTCGQIFQPKVTLDNKKRLLIAKWKAKVDYLGELSSTEAFTVEILSDVSNDLLERELEVRLENFESLWFNAMQQIDERKAR